MDVTDPTMQEMAEIGKAYNLDQFTIMDCMEPDHLPKYDEINEVHFLIVRFFAHDFHKRVVTIQDVSNKIAIFYNGNFIITIHKPKVAFLETIQRKFVATDTCTTPAQVVTKILWYTLNSYDDPAQRLSEQIDFHENNIMVRKTTVDQLESLYYIKRQASVSHKVITLMAEPINHVNAVEKDDIALQDVLDEHLKIQTLYTQVYEDVNNLMNLYLSFTAQRTNDVMKVLTIFSVFFMPLTFISGIYGMNFKFMPELEHHSGYPLALLLMVATTLTLYFWMKRKRWL
ncbi:CorA family divalent cation transporter [Paraflavisolibacter sp. H34]|uniref:CorA family divalent cation transporter n=1 Tax=Huijunlia imazamoxiresistens TaxID=3127457 RepID=UPI0030169C0C